MSTTHTVHPDSHEEGLADGCERCVEHAQHPFTSLDDEMLRALLERVCGGEPGRSQTEELAMFNLEQILMQASQLAKLNPVSFARYMKKRGVHLIAVVGQ